ncbi:MAG: hypothetical protein ACREBJ_01630 [Nitrosotalea sp.]
MLILSSSQTALGYDKNNSPTFEDQLGNSTKTTLVNDYSIILNQTTPKLTYDIGETIPINATLVNVGNKTVQITYFEPEFFLEIKNQAGEVVWPQNSRIGWVPEPVGTKTLKPGERFSEQPWRVTQPGVSHPAIRLLVEGNYTVISVGLFTFNNTDSAIPSYQKPIWSKPMQITILPEKVPEFPFAIPILLVSITSLIIFYRLKFKNGF